MDFTNHPCFNSEARHTAGRIHLPVARGCNIQCNFCNRKYDCANENRPGVCSAILTPVQAAAYLDSALEKIPRIAVVGIAGPGDPFASPEETLQTLRLVRERHPDKLLCLATNGLGLPEYIERLAGLKLSHVTITVNAIDPGIGAKIYAWVRFGPKVYRGPDGARLLLQRQTESIRRLKETGVTVKINTVIIPGVNDNHAPEVAAYTARLGADVQNCMPLVHAEGSAFAHIPPASPENIRAQRILAGKHIPQMSHCARCRADAAGLIGAEQSGEAQRLLAEAAVVKASKEKPYVAAVSMEGLFVNRHLGDAPNIWIYGLENGAVILREQRPAPAPGSGDARWEALAETLSDCCALLVSHCGQNPKKILEGRGLPVITAEGLIADIALPVMEGKSIPKIFSISAAACGAGASCGGKGMGCG
ncbi:MAG: radical SAM protein [Treponema sp.]|jgi:nitrogen fixation protein NifB|nr:radical SAM protein [Treponema sp.]